MCRKGSRVRTQLSHAILFAQRRSDASKTIDGQAEPIRERFAPQLDGAPQTHKGAADFAPECVEKA